jgi:hypothetical protein
VCPFKFVSRAFEKNHENPNHPAVKFWYNTYHNYFPKHCMVCNAKSHGNIFCPHDDMKFTLRGPRSIYHDKHINKGYVPPSQFPWNLVTFLWSSTPDDSSESSTDVNEIQDQGANIPLYPPEPPNPPCPMPPPPVSVYSSEAAPSNYVGQVSIESVREPQVSVAPETSGPTNAESIPYELPSTRWCTYCKREHVDTVVDCPFWYLAMQLALTDDHEGDAAITHLSYMFHCKVPVNRPQRIAFIVKRDT